MHNQSCWKLQDDDQLCCSDENTDETDGFVIKTYGLICLSK